jgi:hypothetical protein
MSIFDNNIIINNINEKLNLIDCNQNKNIQTVHILDLYQYLIDNFDKIKLIRSTYKGLFDGLIIHADSIVDDFSDPDDMEGMEGENHVVYLCHQFIDIMSSIEERE